MDTNTRVFFRSSVFPNTEILVRQLWYWRRHHNIRKSVSPVSQFSDPVLFFFTVRSNTFIYFLIKVDLCTSCDKPGITLSFIIRSPRSVLLSFVLPSFFILFSCLLLYLFIIYLLFFFFLFLLFRGVVTIRYDSSIGGNKFRNSYVYNVCKIRNYAIYY